MCTVALQGQVENSPRELGRSSEKAYEGDSVLPNAFLVTISLDELDIPRCLINIPHI